MQKEIATLEHEINELKDDKLNELGKEVRIFALKEQIAEFKTNNEPVNYGKQVSRTGSK